MDHFTYKEHVDYILNDTVVDATIESIRGNHIILNLSDCNSKITTRANNENILKRWKKGQEFKLFNRVDVRSNIDKMIYEGYVADIFDDKINIKYNLRGKICTEEFDINSKNIYPIGTFSSKFNPNKFTSEDVNKMLKKSRYNVNLITNYSEPIESNTNSKDCELELEENIRKEKLKRFFEISLKNGFKLTLIQGDGNCLYRSFSHQLYGNEDYYYIVKNAILDYLELEKDFFSQFVCRYSFEEYINMKRLDGVWGDDLEIQACSEIYNVQILIYTDDNDMSLLKRFNDDESNLNRKKKITISYHGKEHYNSLMIANEKKIIYEEPGIYEKSFIESVKSKKIINQKENQIDKIVSDINNITINNNSISNINENFDLEKVRQFFVKGKFLNENNEFIINLDKDKENNNATFIESNKLENDISNKLISKSEIDYNDNLVLESILKESRKDIKNNNLDSQNNNYQNIILSVIEMGFNEEEVMLAYSAVGGDIDLILQYLYSLNY